MPIAKPSTAQQASAATRGHAGANCQATAASATRHSGIFCRGSGPLRRLSTRSAAAVSSAEALLPRLSTSSRKTSNWSLFMLAILITQPAEGAAQILFTANQQGLHRRNRSVENFRYLRVAHAVTISERDGRALTCGQLRDCRRDHAVAFVAFGLGAGVRRRVDDLARGFQLDPGRPPLAVDAEIDNHAGEPGAKECQGLRARRGGPYSQHGFLRHVLGVGSVAEDAAGKPEHRRQVSTGEFPECALIAARDPGHERFVAVVHRSRLVAIRESRLL